MTEKEFANIYKETMADCIIEIAAGDDAKHIDTLWPHIEAALEGLEEERDYYKYQNEANVVLVNKLRKKLDAEFNAGLDQAITKCKTRINMQTPNLKISNDAIVELHNLLEELTEAKR